MHQTTVRFGPDLWEALEVECGRLGVSAAQYIRESALARLAYSAGREGSPAYEMALETAGAAPIQTGGVVIPLPTSRVARRTLAAATAANLVAEDEHSSSEALKAQSDLVLARARVLRERSTRIRDRQRERSR